MMIRPTREDARVSETTVFHYSKKLGEQIVTLEAENVDLQDAKRSLTKENRAMREKLDQLDRENVELRDAGLATIHERHVVVRQAQEAVNAKIGEANIQHNLAEKQRQRAEALSFDNDRMKSMNERLRLEVAQLQRKVLGLETTANAMQAQLASQAEAEAEASRIRGSLERQLDSLTLEKRRLDEQTGALIFESAQLRRLQEALAQECERGCKLTEDFRASRAEVVGLQQEKIQLMDTVANLHLEIAQLSQQAVAAENPSLREDMRRAEGTTQSLRGRIAELENIITEHRRGRIAVDAENGRLKNALAAAQADAERSAAMASCLASERGEAEQFADELAKWRCDAEMRISQLASEGAHLRSRSDQVRADGKRVQERAGNLEAENILLRGQLHGADVLVRGLREECSRLQKRLSEEVVGRRSGEPLELRRALDPTFSSFTAAAVAGVVEAAASANVAPIRHSPPSPLQQSSACFGPLASKAVSTTSMPTLHAPVCARPLSGTVASLVRPAVGC
eukprot:TRINITY_DN74739_c0_g1_i1.p1 TRINITY_DN74739_c0_g1~~TRINITY_DN74739_c0_g1_i1.p1  ORF type:complete len:512 (-),score=107.50 TRINITY_DN74739_c0_g1_i1:61-1596(-)